MKEYLISIPLKILNRENMFWQHYYKDNKAISSLVFANMFQVSSWNLLKKKSFDALKFPWQGFYHHPFPKKKRKHSLSKKKPCSQVISRQLHNFRMELKLYFWFYWNCKQPYFEVSNSISCKFSDFFPIFRRNYTKFLIFLRKSVCSISSSCYEKSKIKNFFGQYFCLGC